MKRFLGIAGLGFGLALGGGLVYALHTSESTRLMVVFLLGALVFGSAVLLTAMLVNRQWTRAIGQQRTTHNYRYQAPQIPPAVFPSPEQRAPDLLPPPEWPMFTATMPAPQDVDDEVVA